MSVYLMPKMDAVGLARFDDWLDALRSGKFVQFQGFLGGVDDGGLPMRCCLGVLRDVRGSDEPDDGEVLNDGKSVLRYGGGEGAGGAPSLYLLNDGDPAGRYARADFEEIADILEADFLGLLDGAPVEVTA